MEVSGSRRVIPVVGDRRVERFGDSVSQPARHLLIGGSGAIGSVVGEDLVRRGDEVTVVDPRPPGAEGVHWIRGTTSSAVEDLAEATGRSDYVFFLATGAPDGWHGLLEAEIAGLRSVVDLCVSSRSVKRLILASSNHVSGGHELDSMAGYPTQIPTVRSPLRPDGLYGAVKAFAEALVRSASELYCLPVSVLRIGTMREIDDPSAYVDAPEFRKYGKPDAVRSRLGKSWLYHGDLIRMYAEEITSADVFRLRFASSSPGSLWDGAIERWSPPTGGEVGPTAGEDR